VSTGLAEALAALLLEDPQLRPARLAVDDADDLGIGDEGEPATMSPAARSTSRTWSNVKAEPCSPGVPSTSTTAPGVTFNCRPRA
jgi:hypothetical protein